MAGTAIASALNVAPHQGTEAHNVVGEVSNIVTDLETLRARLALAAESYADMVLPSAVAGLSVDGANAENPETDNTIVIRKNGISYRIPAITEIDISALISAAATVDTSDHGILWVFVNTAGTADVEVALTPAVQTSAITAWAQWATAARTLPPEADDVCIGAIHVTEGGSGAFTWGTDSLTTETEVYHDFYGLPGVETALATFAATAGAAATFAYGAGKVRLGTGTLVSATGKTGVTIGGSNVADGAVGAWLFYILADDTELAHQIGNDYADLAEAQEAVRTHNANPMLPLAGVIYVENGSGAAYVPGTTNFNVAGLTSTFEICTPVTSRTAYIVNAADLIAAQLATREGVVLT